MSRKEDSVPDSSRSRRHLADPSAMPPARDEPVREVGGLADPGAATKPPASDATTGASRGE